MQQRPLTLLFRVSSHFSQTAEVLFDQDQARQVRVLRKIVNSHEHKAHTSQESQQALIISTQATATLLLILICHSKPSHSTSTHKHKEQRQQTTPQTQTAAVPSQQSSSTLVRSLRLTRFAFNIKQRNSVKIRHPRTRFEKQTQKDKTNRRHDR